MYAQKFFSLDTASVAAAACTDYAGMEIAKAQQRLNQLVVSPWEKGEIVAKEEERGRKLLEGEKAFWKAASVAIGVETVVVVSCSKSKPSDSFCAKKKLNRSNYGKQPLLLVLLRLPSAWRASLEKKNYILRIYVSRDASSETNMGSNGRSGFHWNT